MPRSSRTGFTLVELAICLSLLAIITPLIYSYALGIEDRSVVGLWHLQTADSLHTVSESLQSDGRKGTLQPTGIAFKQGDCTVTYRAEDAALLRTDSCGITQTLAVGVSSLARESDGVSIGFTRHLRAGRDAEQTLFIPVGSP